MTTANMITFLRLVLSIVFILSFIRERFAVALIVFLIGSLTDGIDGFVARRRKEVTEIGKMFDPLCDKFLIDSGFILLSLSKVIPIWLFIVVVIRDALILSGSLALIMQGKSKDVKPTYVGKITAFLQFATIIEALLIVNGIDIGITSFELTCTATAALTIISGFTYAYRGMGNAKKVLS